MAKYARFDPKAPQPAPVLGWYDADRLRYALVPADSALGRTRGVINRIEVDGAPVGTVAFAGPGAGGDATSSAILGDLVAVARGAGSTWAGLPEAAPVRSDPAAVYVIQGRRYRTPRYLSGWASSRSVPPRGRGGLRKENANRGRRTARQGRESQFMAGVNCPGSLTPVWYYLSEASALSRIDQFDRDPISLGLVQNRSRSPPKIV